MPDSTFNPFSHDGILLPKFNRRKDARGTDLDLFIYYNYMTQILK